MDEITPEALEAAGWVRSEVWNNQYYFSPRGVYGPNLAICGNGLQPPVEVGIYCHDAGRVVTIGYALTMSEVNTIATVAMRTMRKE